MGLIYCLIFGIFSFAFNAVVAITVKGEGGISTEEKSSGAKKFRYITGLDFRDWLRVYLLAGLSALMGLIMYAAQFWAIIAFIIGSVQVVYITCWAVKEASEVREVLTFILDALIHFLISRLGVEAARAYGLRPVPGAVFVACVATIIFTTLFFRANIAEEDGEDHAGIMRGLAIAVIFITVIIEVVIIVGMINPAAHWGPLGMTGFETEKSWLLSLGVGRWTMWGACFWALGMVWRLVWGVWINWGERMVREGV